MSGGATVGYHGSGMSTDLAVMQLEDVVFTDNDIGYFDSRMRLNPPLRQQRDRDALREGLADGTIDALVSDHTPVEALSDQERRILTLFAEGGNPAGIARTLRISPQTLRNHLHHINRKLRTHNRLEAVTHAQRRGLIG